MCEGWAQAAKLEGAALMESCYQHVICSRSNYLNIFTGDEGNEGVRKRGMGGKSSFSNCNEVIKKKSGNWTPALHCLFPSAPARFHYFLQRSTGEIIYL